MCLAVYVASDRELPLIEWQESSPSFFVMGLTDEDNKVTKQFSLPNVVYAGTHEGCGCGFFKEGEEGECLEKKQQNYNKLVEYISPVVKDGGRIQIFSCWEGDQDQPQEFKEVVSLELISSSSFEFKEKAYYEVG